MVKQPPKLILASSSEGRKKLLSLLKISFTVIPSTVDEEKIFGQTPLETLKLRAKLKAEDVARKLLSPPSPYPLVPSPYLILSADSGGIVDDKLFGKPKDYDDAVRILTLLSGKTHQFVTAVYGIRINLSQQSKTRSDLVREKWESHEVSLVTFKKLSKEDIKRYLSLTNYKRFACAYALFATPQDFITKIEGSLSNVVGLPLEKVMPILKENNLLA